MTDICNGKTTKYGTTQILESCRLPLLYPNGSYLVFTDLVMKTDLLANSSDLTSDYFTDYSVLEKTHRMNSFNLM